MLFNHIRRGMNADRWFKNLEAKTGPFMERYRDHTHAGVKHHPVKIAILDTGIASQGGADVPNLIRAGMTQKRIKTPWTSPYQDLPPNKDLDGHGTHAAGLLLQVCPSAEIYVYRVTKGLGESISRDDVTAALKDAIERAVDIVSMSLGWDDDNHDGLNKVLLEARAKNVLVFAASSNFGITRGRMAYPARADSVIAIDASDYYGNPSKFNPPPGGRDRFTTLGEEVKSAFPKRLPNVESGGWKRMSGTSCATPIAAAISALILEFARQPPLCLYPEIERRLKQTEGMRQALIATSKQKDHHSNFYHLCPEQYLCGSDNHPDGGSYTSSMSHRVAFAGDITKCLRIQFDNNLATRAEKPDENWQ